MAEAVAIGYGKEAVSIYRTDGVRSLFACEVGMTVRGEAFLPSYTEGDNTLVVATDSMKNFLQATALDYEGSTLEPFLELVARRFLDTYGHVERIELHARELPLARRTERSFALLGGDRAVAELALDRSGAAERRSGRVDIRLVKLGGSSFADFLRDEYTTLAEAHDRPLLVHMDVHWRAEPPPPSTEVRDAVAATFADFDSASIQELVNEMGVRLLAGFPAIGEVSFVAENRLWSTAQVSGTDEQVRVYTEPPPPYGQIELTLRR